MILHLDMDAFFASVEQLDNPGLRGKPVIVGGGDRGVVATASYEARVFGIHSAMPVIQARKLCANAIFIRGNYHRYSEISRRVMHALYSFSPIVQKASIDEAYLDISGTERLFSSPFETAKAIKEKIFSETGGLTCSIGIAPVKFLAKICSDINKPDGVFILEKEEMDAFLANLPVGRLPGVGAHMAESLRKLGITRVSGLRRLSREYMVGRYGKWGGKLHDRAFGIDPAAVRENPPPRSESSEHTFSQDTSDRKFLARALAELAEKVGASLRKNGIQGRTITIKIKYADFRQITRSKTIHTRTNNTATISTLACALLDAEAIPAPVRLVGVCVSGFEQRQEQYTLPGLENLSETAATLKRQSLDTALDAIRGRFGSHSIRTGYALD